MAFKLTDKVGALQIAGLARFSAIALNSVILAKAAYSAEEISSVETFLFFLNLATFIWINTLTTILFREHDQNQTLKQVLYASISMAVLSAWIVGAGMWWFPAWSAGNGWHVLGLLATILWQGPSLLLEPFLFKSDKPRILVVVSLGSAVGLTAFTAVLSFMGYPVIWIEALFLAYTILRGSLLLYWLSKEGIRLRDFRPPWKMMGQALPLFLSSALAGMSEQINGLLVKSELGNADFVLLRYGSREFPLVMILANTFSNSMVQGISSNLQEGLAALKSRSRNLLRLSFAMSIALMFCSKFLFHVLFNPQLEAAYVLFNVILLLTIPRLIFPQTVVLSQRGDRWVLYAVGLELLIDVAVFCLLVPVLGVLAAPLALVAGYLTDKGFLLWIAYRKYQIRPTDYIPVAEWAVGTILLVMVWLFTLTSGFPEAFGYQF